MNHVHIYEPSALDARYQKCKYCPAVRLASLAGEASVGPANDNPCITRFGVGPAGKKCGECCHLHRLHYSNRYYKCDLRKLTHGKGTDHKVRWMACAKFEAGEVQNHYGQK